MRQWLVITRKEARKRCGRCESSDFTPCLEIEVDETGAVSIPEDARVWFMAADTLMRQVTPFNVPNK
jgi:hypothetical protein